MEIVGGLQDHSEETWLIWITVLAISTIMRLNLPDGGLDLSRGRLHLYMEEDWTYLKEGCTCLEEGWIYLEEARTQRWTRTTVPGIGRNYLEGG